MPRMKRCPSNLCGHRDYMDCSDTTCTPEPYCPECMKELHLAEVYADGSGDENEEVF